MRLIWISAYPVYLPKSQKNNNVREGWIQGALNGFVELSKEKKIENTVLNLFPNSNKSISEEYEDEKILYRSFYGNSNDLYVNTNTVIDLKRIFKDFQPDIIHIWGTERTYSCAAVMAAKELGISDTTVISLQGIDSFWGDKLTLEIPGKFTLGFSIPELGTFSSLKKLKNIFDKKALSEKKALNGVNHIIGRTNWDRVAASQINPNAKYHFCNETLRSEFYCNQTWEIDKCEKRSIFVSQGLTCNKGLHQVLKAMPIILKEFPDAKVYTTGNMGYNNKYGIRAYNSYERFLNDLIKRNKLQNKVVFLGKLSAEQMKKQFLNSNVYVCPSSIENESNALSEAKILGTPCVIAYVGGMLDRIEHGVDGYMYPYNEPNILAEYICQIFRNINNTKMISNNAKSRANVINDKNENAKCLYNIYNDIIRNV